MADEQAMLKRQSELWIEERYHDFYSMRFRIEKTLFAGTSDFQHIEVLQTSGHGKMLLNDGLVMVTEKDEFIYHEMMAHVPLFCMPEAKKVLVIGGGDGGTVREVIKHPNIERCVLVEIDPLVVEACKEHIPLTAEALDDPKVEVRIEDGVKFVAETSEKFDLVLIDSTDPIGPAAPLFGVEFYRSVKSILTEQGVAVAQGESPFYMAEEQGAQLKVLGQLFERTHVYNFTNMSYPGGYWSFALASQGLCPLKNFSQLHFEKLGLDLKYYNAGIHLAAFQLPGFMKAKVGQWLSPLPELSLR